MTLLVRLGLSFSFVLFLFLQDGYTAVNNDLPDHAPLSPQTQTCVGCHKIYTPGIVQDWLSSRHSKITPSEAAEMPTLERRISVYKVPAGLSEFAVGCYECHSQNPDSHKDNFGHMGFKINVVVSPNDCKICHSVEVKQFADSKKAHAVKNLMGNPVYHSLVSTITGMKKIEKGNIIALKPSETTLHDTCLGCHGTKVEVKGMKTVPTQIGGIAVPDLTNWPNQGVGRENPDGSIGACTACHPRHSFSIEIARKPYTCGQCHYFPDVPAWNVYMESKHGNIFSSTSAKWDFTSVPWSVGKDFKAPTCATCHNSLLVSTGDNVIVERTHDFGSRLWVRIFGLIYSHPQPKSGNTTIIKNKDGLPMPTTFEGGMASGYLISSVEQEKRLKIMKSVCNGCHSTDWYSGHFAKFENTVKETDKMTSAATELMQHAWDNNIEDRTDPFDGPIERLWVGQWLFYSNSIRYASAMTGAPDYTSFNNGWWNLSENLQNMKAGIEAGKKLREIKAK